MTRLRAFQELNKTMQIAKKVFKIMGLSLDQNTWEFEGKSVYNNQVWRWVSRSKVFLSSREAKALYNNQEKIGEILGKEESVEKSQQFIISRKPLSIFIEPVYKSDIKVKKHLKPGHLLLDFGNIREHVETLFAGYGNDEKGMELLGSLLLTPTTTFDQFKKEVLDKLPKVDPHQLEVERALVQWIGNGSLADAKKLEKVYSYIPDEFKKAPSELYRAMAIDKKLFEKALKKEMQTFGKKKSSLYTSWTDDLEAAKNFAKRGLQSIKKSLGISGKVIVVFKMRIPTSQIFLNIGKLAEYFRKLGKLHAGSLALEEKEVIVKARYFEYSLNDIVFYIGKDRKFHDFG